MRLRLLDAGASWKPSYETKLPRRPPELRRACLDERQSTCFLPCFPAEVGRLQRRRVGEVGIFLWGERFCKAGSQEKHTN